MGVTVTILAGLIDLIQARVVRWHHDVLVLKEQCETERKFLISKLHTLHRERGELAEFLTGGVLDELHTIKRGLSATRGVMITDAKAYHDDHIESRKNLEDHGYMKSIQKKSAEVVARNRIKMAFGVNDGGKRINESNVDASPTSPSSPSAMEDDSME